LNSTKTINNNPEDQYPPVSTTIMSTTTAFQPVAAHQLRSMPSVVPETRRKTEIPANLSGSVEAKLSFFEPPTDGSKVWSLSEQLGVEKLTSNT
jgi:hypothetical protein